MKLFINMSFLVTKKIETTFTVNIWKTFSKVNYIHVVENYTVIIITRLCSKTE